MLKLADVSSMHNTMINHYHSMFAHNAPPEWQDDPWFTESVPLIVSMKYGQDLEIDTENLDEMRTAFDQSCTFEHISRWSLALASHFR